MVSTSTPSTTNNLWYNPNATGTTATLGAAGKNFIINGGMEVNQRNVTSLTSGVYLQYTIDRWYVSVNANNGQFSQQAPWTTLAGFSQSVRFYQGGINATAFNFSQSLETNNVVPLQGQTVTLSFYASVDKANYDSLPFSVFLKYSTGTNANLYNSGASITPTAVSNITASTGLIASVGSWTRCTATFTVPSTATSLAVVFSTPAVATSGAEFNITGVQLEANPVATVFSRTGGTYQGELAQCQRYYYQQNSDATNVYAYYSLGTGISTTQGQFPIVLPVTLRDVPSSVVFANLLLTSYIGAAGNAATAVSLVTNSKSTYEPMILVTVATGIAAAGRYILVANNSSSSYIGLSAEL